MEVGIVQGVIVEVVMVLRWYTSKDGVPTLIALNRWEAVFGTQEYFFRPFFIFSSVLVLPLTSPSSTLQMQYSFIYQALLEYYLYGDTELDVCSLEGHLHRLHNTRAPNDRLGLEEEFRVG